MLCHLHIWMDKKVAPIHVQLFSRNYCPVCTDIFCVHCLILLLYRKGWSKKNYIVITHPPKKTKRKINARKILYGRIPPFRMCQQPWRKEISLDCPIVKDNNAEGAQILYHVETLWSNSESKTQMQEKQLCLTLKVWDASAFFSEEKVTDFFDDLWENTICRPVDLSMNLNTSIFRISRIITFSSCKI